MPRLGMPVRTPQQLQQIGLAGERQLRDVTGVQLQHRDQRGRVLVRLRLKEDAVPSHQVDRAARGDPDPLVVLLHGFLTDSPPAVVGGVVDLAEALQVLRRDRLAAFGHQPAVAHRPGLLGRPQQRPAKRAVTAARRAGAWMQTNRPPAEWAKLGKDRGDVQRRWWRGPDHRSRPPSGRSLSGVVDREDGSARRCQSSHAIQAQAQAGAPGA